MTMPESVDYPILHNVFHPSDFSPASETAFAHALKAALIATAGLTILHVSPQRDQEWMEFPECGKLSNGGACCRRTV